MECHHPLLFVAIKGVCTFGYCSKSTRAIHYLCSKRANAIMVPACLCVVFLFTVVSAQGEYVITSPLEIEVHGVTCNYTAM